MTHQLVPSVAPLHRAARAGLLLLVLIGGQTLLPSSTAAQVPSGGLPESMAEPTLSPGSLRPPATVAAPRATGNDLSGSLPVVQPTRAPTTVPATAAALPATLTPTRVPPTATPVPTAAAIATTPSPVLLAASPALDPPTSVEPPPTSPGAVDAPSAVRESAAPAAAPRPGAYTLPVAPQPAPVPRRYVTRLPEERGPVGWLDDNLLWLGVPSRSQYDGTPYAGANCGPSALGMILEAYGLWMPTTDLRHYANYLQGSWGYDDGIALDHLAEIGRRANLKPIGLYEGRGYHRWTVDEVRESVLAGHPVIALTTYRKLPGNAYFGGNINHYIVISGLFGDDFLYNDSAFGGSGGRGLVITAEQLDLAWISADIPRHALAFGLGEQAEGLLGSPLARLGRGGGAALSTLPRLLTASAADSPSSLARPLDRADNDGPRSLGPAAANSLTESRPTGPALLNTQLLGETGPAVGRPLLMTLLPPEASAADLADVTQPLPHQSTALVLAPNIWALLAGVLGLQLLLLVRALLNRRAPRTPNV